jgi:uncharacterized membrane protein YedE/YeeE
MGRILSAFLIGGLFGIGIAISGMANPAKVLNFFDIAGTWDPSLIFVMGGALVVTAIGYRVVFARRAAPVFERHFAVPTLRSFDWQFVGGSALFGVGWGLSGFCPGGVIPALALGYAEVPIFIAAMIAGILIARALKRLQPAPARA